MTNGPTKVCHGRVTAAHMACNMGAGNSLLQQILHPWCCMVSMVPVTDLATSTRVSSTVGGV